MQKREKILDDMARLAGGTVGIASGITHNIRAEIKSRVDEIVDRLDLVPRADLDRLEAILQETRKEHEDLKLRIETLEKKKK
ncbi:MAG: accessory factor UbiK family protein [Alphaproteobacteria bacterium]|nr:accessory factor UbiK family protein [Alphaproteobacteria bacterium]